MSPVHIFCFCLIVIFLMRPFLLHPGSGGVDGDVLASLAPPVHLSGERLGWTLLVCMVSDIRRGRLHVSWRSPSESHTSTAQHSIAVNKKHHGHSAVAIITVATREWPSFSCSVSHRRHPKLTRRHLTSSSGRYITNHMGAYYCVFIFTNLLTHFYHLRRSRQHVQ